jgi:hypothetical protein
MEADRQKGPRVRAFVMQEGGRRPNRRALMDDLIELLLDLDWARRSPKNPRC